MTFRLSPEAQRKGYRLEGHVRVGSTNAMALERAKAGDPGRLWISALKQETGRGRRGRAWETPEGNLAATLMLVLRGVQQPAALGFVAGLSLSDALNRVAPNLYLSVGMDGGATPQGGRFTLKWPNDVLADGAKLAGILLESAFLPDGAMAVAVGIGVNVVAHPNDLPYPATSLHSLGFPVDAEGLFEALSAAWAENSAIWDDGHGLDAIRRKWLTRAAGLGSEVSVKIDHDVVRGTFETIDGECRFVLREANGRTRLISAGDVHFGAVASAGAA